MQPVSSLAVVAAPAAGLVEIDVLMCLGAVLVCLALVGTRLPGVLDETNTVPVEEQFGPSAVNSKSDRAAGSLSEDVLAVVLGDVEEGGVVGVGYLRTRAGAGPPS